MQLTFLVLKLPTAAIGSMRQHGAVVVLLVLACALTGCILGSEHPKPDLEIPARYREAPASQADAALPALDWWRGFHSTELTSLIEQAQTYNLDIAVAYAQIVQADAAAGVARAPLFPSITGTATAERIRNAASPSQEAWHHRPHSRSTILD